MRSDARPNQSVTFARCFSEAPSINYCDLLSSARNQTGLFQLPGAESGAAEAGDVRLESRPVERERGFGQLALAAAQSQLTGQEQDRHGGRRHTRIVSTRHTRVEPETRLGGEDR